jgi:hypothetical protein
MPASVLPRFTVAWAGALALSALATLAFTGTARAAVLAELRVEGPDGTLDPGTWYVTGGENVRRSKSNDNCVRTRGKIEVRGATALGLAQTGSEATPDLRQVRVRRDQAGLFVCEIGSVAGRPFTHPDGFAGWSYYEDLVFGSSSADLARLQTGDQILWVYSDFGATTPANTGSALELLQVPAGDQDGQFQVKVVAHQFDGSTVNVDDAEIEGAATATPVGSDGLYNVTVSQGMTTLRATRGLDIPSNHVDACYQPSAADCPVAHGRRIVGSDERDRLAGTAGWDEIRSGGGRDRVELTDGGRDQVNCGPGQRDAVVIAPGDPDDQVASNCERVREGA